MKCMFDRQELRSALEAAGHIIKGRTPQPILQCVKLVPEGSKVMLYATSLETWIKVTINQVEIAEPAPVCVNADKLSEILRSMSDQTVSLAVEGEMLVVKGQSAKFKIYTQSADAFPAAFKNAAEGVEFKIESSTLSRILDKASVAVGKVDGTFTYTGIALVLTGKKLDVVGTDGRRMMVVRHKVESEKATGFLAPSACTAINSVMPEDEEITIRIESNRVWLTSAHVEFTTLKREGRIVPYEDVIPKKPDKWATAATAELLSAVKQAQIVSTEESSSVACDMGPKGIALTARTSVQGEVDVVLPCKYEGSPMTIGFDPRYMLDGLRHVDTDEVKIGFNEPNTPIVFHAGDMTYVVLPVQVK